MLTIGDSRRLAVDNNSSSNRLLHYLAQHPQLAAAVGVSLAARRSQLPPLLVDCLVVDKRKRKHKPQQRVLVVVFSVELQLRLQVEEEEEEEEEGHCLVVLYLLPLLLLPRAGVCSELLQQLPLPQDLHPREDYLAALPKQLRRLNPPEGSSELERRHQLLRLLPEGDCLVGELYSSLLNHYCMSHPIF